MAVNLTPGVRGGGVQVTLVLPPDTFALLADLVAERLAAISVAQTATTTPTSATDLDARIVALMADGVPRNAEEIAVRDRGCVGKDARRVRASLKA